MAQMARHDWNGWKWLEIEIDGYGLKWDGLITILEIWGVWVMKIGGFPIWSGTSRCLV